MTIQGIITGFADPDNQSINRIAIGRGEGYALIVDGKLIGRGDSLNDCWAHIEACPQDWRCITHTKDDGFTVHVIAVGGYMRSDYNH